MKFEDVAGLRILGRRAEVRGLGFRVRDRC